MTHFELGPASIGAVAKSEAKDPFRARGVAAALAALYQHMRCVCFVACCFSVRLLTLSALSYCGCLAACAQSCPEKILSRIGATHASVRFSISRFIQTLSNLQFVTSGLLKCFAKVAPPRMDSLTFARMFRLLMF